VGGNFVWGRWLLGVGCVVGFLVFFYLFVFFCWCFFLIFFFFFFLFFFLYFVFFLCFFRFYLLFLGFFFIFWFLWSGSFFFFFFLHTLLYFVFFYFFFWGLGVGWCGVCGVWGFNSFFSFLSPWWFCFVSTSILVTPTGAFFVIVFFSCHSIWGVNGDSFLCFLCFFVSLFGSPVISFFFYSL